MRRCFLSRLWPKSCYLGLLHLLVDFVSASSLFFACSALKKTGSFAGAFLLYNGLAFLLQPFFGAYLDPISASKGRDAFFGASLSLLLIGWILSSLAKSLFASLAFLYAGASFLGLGNAAYHVYGGKEVLSAAKKSAPGGVYVSLGALGIGLAGLCSGLGFSSLPSFLLYLLGPLLFLLLGAIWLFAPREKELPAEAPYEGVRSGKAGLWALLAVSLAVMGRSFLGFSLPDGGIEANLGVVFLFSFTAFLGKAAGGFLEDLLGPIPLIGFASAFSLLPVFANAFPFPYALVAKFCAIFSISFGIVAENMMVPLPGERGVLLWLRRRIPGARVASCLLRRGEGEKRSPLPFPNPLGLLDSALDGVLLRKGETPWEGVSSSSFSPPPS